MPRLPRPRLPRLRDRPKKGGGVARRDRPKKGGGVARRDRPRSPGRSLRPAIDFGEGVIWTVRERLRRLGGGISRFWFRRSLGFRRRTAAVAAIVGLYLIVRALVIPDLPCGISAAKECAPGDDAIALVPADAIAYAHLSLDRDSGQFEDVSETLGSLPLLAAAANQGIGGALGLPPGGLISALEPWLGDELAAALLPAGSSGEGQAILVLAEVDDDDAAAGFTQRLGGGQPQRVTSDGIEVSVYPSGIAAARLDDFLALGTPDSVRAAIETARGGEPLESAEAAEEARDALPDERVADLYVSQAGIDALAGAGGLAGQFDLFLDYSSSRGAIASLIGSDGGLELRIRSLLDPDRSRAAPGFLSAFESFDPGLARHFGADSFAYLEIGDPSRSAQGLLDQARASVPGLADAFNDLNRRLEATGGVDIERTLFPLLSGRAAIAATAATPLPYLTAVFEDVSEDEVREAVARLQAPIIAAFDPAETGQAAAIEQSEVDGVEVISVRLSAALHLSYAVFDGRLVIATDPRGVEQAIAGGDGLAGDEGFRVATAGPAESVSALLFLDLEGLVKLAEPRGLNEITPYATFRTDIEKLRGLGLRTISGEDSLEARLFLDVE